VQLGVFGAQGAEVFPGNSATRAKIGFVEGYLHDGVFSKLSHTAKLMRVRRRKTRAVKVENTGCRSFSQQKSWGVA
jgi:hypothetical protein